MLRVTLHEANKIQMLMATGYTQEAIKIQMLRVTLYIQGY